MFRGLTGLNLDSKSRLAIPTKYRVQLNDLCAAKLIITIDTEQPCLLLYPFTQWQEIEQKLISLPSFNAAARRIQRLLIGHATEVELDGNGRFIIPTPLREYADLQKKLVLVGQGNKFEIWSDSYWREARETWLAQPLEEDNLPIELETLSL